MKKALRFALALLALATTCAAEQWTLVRNYDLNNPTIGATSNRIVTLVNLTNTSFTIAAQPDVPRNITIAVTDTTPSITAGTITVTCLDVNGATMTEALNLATGLSFTGTKLCKTVSSVAASGVTVLGGGGDEKIIVGVGSVVGYVYCSTSSSTNGSGRVVTDGSSTTVTSTNAAFGPLAAGDEIVASYSGTSDRRIVASKASSSSLTLTAAANWDNNDSGYSWSYRHVTCDTSDTTGWIGVGNLQHLTVKVDIGDGSGAAVTATGGIDISIECAESGDGASPAQILAVNWPVTQTLRPTHSEVYNITERCSAVRVGWKFGTVDTAGTDSVSAYLVGDQK